MSGDIKIENVTATYADAIRYMTNEMISVKDNTEEATENLGALAGAIAAMEAMREIDLRGNGMLEMIAFVYGKSEKEVDSDITEIIKERLA